MMSTLKTLKDSIYDVGVKEVARRSGLSASTVSRIGSGQFHPGLETAELISIATGYRLELVALNGEALPLRKSLLNQTLKILRELKPHLNRLGVKHLIVFGSVARQEEEAHSDLDIYLDFGNKALNAAELLRAEGKIIEAFPKLQVDFVTDLKSNKGKKLKIQIDQDGKNAF